MGKRLKFFFIFLMIFGCVEPYTFTIQNDTPTLVVEGFISDKSYTETLSYPSDGRHFSVKVSHTGNVTNGVPIMISSAQVVLISETGGSWNYTESSTEPGVYYLLMDDFKAIPGVDYKLQVTPPQDNTYESDWESLPDAEAPLMGDIGFEEIEKQHYAIVAKEKVIETVKGITVKIAVPKNDSGDELFYRWKFSPAWIYTAPLPPPESPIRRCWIRGDH